MFVFVQLPRLVTIISVRKGPMRRVNIPRILQICPSHDYKVIYINILSRTITSKQFFYNSIVQIRSGNLVNARLKSTRFHVLDSHTIMRTTTYTVYPRISYINSLELWVEIHLTRRENAYCIRIHLFDLVF